MAAVDKIYLKKKDYDLYIRWINNNTYVKNSIREVLKNGCVIVKSKEYFAVCDYSYIIDHFLANHCPFGFILNRLCEQYCIDIDSVQDI